jgi:NAD(P)-dependent dehydrogenase (short-subunit alcohol dehydrogenase family)
MDDWNWVMNVNFYGVLYGVRAFIPRMREQKTTSHVVNVSSLIGLTPGRGGPYRVSKHAVVVLTESLYHELADTAPHVHLSVYCPVESIAETAKDEGNACASTTLYRRFRHPHLTDIRGSPQIAVFDHPHGYKVMQNKAEFFPKDFPAWTVVGVSALALPELLFEVKATAVIGSGAF